MTAWIVVGSIVLALLLISLIRVGGVAEYSQSGLLAKLRLGAIQIQLYPAREKKEKEKRKKESREAPEEEQAPPAKPGGGVGQLKRYLPLIADAAGRLKRKIRIDKLNLDFIAAAGDPAAAAMEYGYANAAVGMIWPLFEQNFKVKERRIRTAVDFSAPKPTVYVYAALSLTIGQALSLGLGLTVRFIKIASQMKAEQKTEKEAVNHGK